MQHSAQTSHTKTNKIKKNWFLNNLSGVKDNYIKPMASTQTNFTLCHPSAVCANTHIHLQWPQDTQVLDNTLHSSSHTLHTLSHTSPSLSFSQKREELVFDETKISYSIYCLLDGILKEIQAKAEWLSERLPVKPQHNPRNVLFSKFQTTDAATKPWKNVCYLLHAILETN